MRLLARSLWVLPLVAFLVGCDSQPTLDTPDVDGSYLGFGGGYTFEIDLAQADGALTGTGLLLTPEGSFSLTVEGAYTFPVIGFSLDATPFAVFTFDGRVSNGGDLLTGTVESANGFDAEVSFQRQ